MCGLRCSAGGGPAVFLQEGGLLQCGLPAAGLGSSQGRLPTHPGQAGPGKRALPRLYEVGHLIAPSQPRPQSLKILFGF